MPIQIKPAILKYKDSNGEYQGIDCLTGLSPTVSVTDISGGHRVTITDANGPHSFDVMDGSVIDAPVQDVQVNGSSVLSNGVANVPITNSSIWGVTKSASSGYIKGGSTANQSITPWLQHESAFYGLAKAAGADMASLASTTVGTYPDAQKASINNMIGSVSKDSLDNAGITNRTYTTKFDGEFTVTTATNASYISPYARASVTGRISKHYMHRVTINGTEYILQTRLWGDRAKTYEYLGNLGLYLSDISGIPGGTDNVPFVIISDLNNSSSIDVLTQTAGTYTIKVEQINVTRTRLPSSLIYGDAYVPFQTMNNGGTYNGFSVGVNKLANSRGTFAFGYNNEITKEFAFAFGLGNKITAPNAIAFCLNNTINGTGSFTTGQANVNNGMLAYVEGSNNTINATAPIAHVEGAGNTASATRAHIEGQVNVANESAICAHIHGQGNVVNGNFATVIGTYSNPDTIISAEWTSNTHYNVGDKVIYSYFPYVCLEENTDSSFTASKWKQLPAKGDSAFLIGCGTKSTEKANAFSVDWSGNARLSGNVYVGCAADSSGGKMLPTDVQVNGTSIVGAQGVANIPMASSNNLGVVKINNSYGIVINPATGDILTQSAADAQIKEATNWYRPITPYYQHVSVFYGLAKAAGDASQSSSNNTVGTYTDEAKIAIQKMLGIYEAPWELIREDTFTNATQADHEITVDGNGQPFELTDAILMFETPKQDTPSAKGYYGGLIFTDGTDNKVIIYSTAWTQAANETAHACWLVAEQKKGLLFIYGKSSSKTASSATMMQGYVEGFDPSKMLQSIRESNNLIIRGAKIPEVTGTGHYKLFGKRKWN